MALQHRTFRVLLTAARTIFLTRWATVAFYCVIAGSLVALLQAALPERIDGLILLIAGLGASLHLILIATTLALAAAVIARRWRFTTVRYPPAWFGAGISVALAMLAPAVWEPQGAIAEPVFDVAHAMAHASLLGWTAAIAIFLFGIARANSVTTEDRLEIGSVPPERTEARPGDSTPMNRLLALPDAEFRSWIASDEPASSDDYDLLPLGPLSATIARHLSDATANTSVVLIGPVGSGKTTTAHRVLASLRSSSTDVFLLLSLWPFADQTSAAEGLLEAISSQLRRHVTVDPIRGISRDYAAAISGLHPVLGTLNYVLGSRPSPNAILDSINTLLVQSGLRLVIWIDDLDRLAAPSQVATDQRKASTIAHGPLMSLLQHLATLTRVSLVVATTEEALPADSGKLFRHKEFMPRLDLHSKWSLAHHALALLDRVYARRKPTFELVLDPPGRDGILLYIHEAEIGSDNWKLAALGLVDTPRVLKSVLRRFETWYEYMHGECDPGELFIAAVLREVEPGIYAQLQQYSRAFRRETWCTSVRAPKAEQSEPSGPSKRLMDLLNSIEPKRGVQVRQLVRTLFPRSLSNDNEAEPPPALCPDQAFCQPRQQRRDPWLALENRSLLPASSHEDPSDQNILEMNWTPELLAGFISRGLGCRIAHLVPQTVGDQLPAICAELFGAIGSGVGIGDQRINWQTSGRLVADVLTIMEYRRNHNPERRYNRIAETIAPLPQQLARAILCDVAVGVHVIGALRQYENGHVRLSDAFAALDGMISPDSSGRPNLDALSTRLIQCDPRFSALFLQAAVEHVSTVRRLVLKPVQPCPDRSDPSRLLSFVTNLINYCCQNYASDFSAHAVLLVIAPPEAGNYTKLPNGHHQIVELLECRSHLAKCILSLNEDWVRGEVSAGYIDFAKDWARSVPL